MSGSLYTLTTEPSQLAASSQVSASGQVATSCLCRLLSHQNLLWHHRLGHPSLPCFHGMHYRLLVSGLPRSLPPLPPSPTPPCLPCVEGRKRAAPHSSMFPPTTAPLHTLHMDDVPVLRLHSHRGDEFSSNLLRNFCRGEGILQSFTLPASHQQNGIAECRIGLVMEVARTSMIHAAAPHFLWSFAVRYAAHQLNLWPRVSLPETSPTLRWTRKVGDAPVFRVWGSRAFERDMSADKLSPLAIPCVFLGFVPDAPGWQFYHPTSRRVFPSLDVTFDESVPFYRLFPYRSATPPPLPLFLAPGPPPVDPLPGPAPVQVAVDSGASRGAAFGGAEPGGAESEGAEIGGVETGGAEPGGAASEGAEAASWSSLRSASSWSSEEWRSEALEISSWGSELWEAESWGSEWWGSARWGFDGGGEPGGAEPEGVEPGGATLEVAESGGAGAAGAGGPGVAAAAGVTGGTATTGPGGARTRGTGVAGTGGVEGARAGAPTKSGAAGAGGSGAGGGGASGARAAGVGAVDPGAGGPGDTVRPRPYFVPLLQQVLGVLSSTGLTPALLYPPPDQSQLPLQPASPLPAPSPCQTYICYSLFRL
ncbi:unnamed protein product [Closterium sp. NIES-53]